MVKEFGEPRALVETARLPDETRSNLKTLETSQVPKIMNLFAMKNQAVPESSKPNLFQNTGRDRKRPAVVCPLKVPIAVCHANPR